MRRIVQQILFIGAMCLSVTGLASEGKTIYVDGDVPAGGDGSSWTTAYRFLQDALVEAEVLQEPVEIRVAQGF